MFSPSLDLLVYLVVPLLIKARFPRAPGADAAVVLLLWFPVEFQTVSGPIFAVAGGALLVAIYEFRWPIATPWNMGWRVKSLPRDLLVAGGGLVALALVLIPATIALNFARLGAGPPILPLLAPIFVFALLEEILFRGTIQNLLELRWHHGPAALAATAVLFGLSHLNNRTLHGGVPNWRYAMLATIAGIGYGAVFRRTRNLWASAVTHTLVNVTWKAWLAA